LTKKLVIAGGLLAAVIAGPRLIRMAQGGASPGEGRETEILAAPIPIKDHGRLIGLGDDDHPHYLLADGTREAAHLIITDGAGHYLQVPQLTSAQRDALSAVNGMIIYNITTGQFERYEAGSWGALGAGEHGAALHTNVTRELFLPVYGYTSGEIAFWGYHSSHSLADGEDKNCNFSLKVPDDFVSFTKLEAVWGCSAAAGNMYWRFQAYYHASGEIYSLHDDLPALGTTATGGANILNVQEPANPLTLASLAAGDYVGVFFRREGSNVLDSLAASVEMIGLLFTYMAEQ